MLLFTFAPLFGLFYGVWAMCGTPHPSEDMRALHRSYTELESQIQPRDTTEPYVVNTYFHIPKPRDDDNAKWWSSILNQQMDVLNQEFANTGFSFNLVSTPIIEKGWVYMDFGDQNEFQVKISRRGRYRDLNIYMAGISSGLLGYATFPNDANETAFILDGVVITPYVLPGQQDRQRNSYTGKVLAHEVGHWLSLFHTFEWHDGTSGCDGAGDYIEDTPAEASPATGCPEKRDTCASPGLDPIHNQMDYTTDSCRTGFTPGQVRRMQTSYVQTRINYKQGYGEETEDDPVAVPGPHPG